MDINDIGDMEDANASAMEKLQRGLITAVKGTPHRMPDTQAYVPPSQPEVELLRELLVEVRKIREILNKTNDSK